MTPDERRPEGPGDHEAAEHDTEVVASAGARPGTRWHPEVRRHLAYGWARLRRVTPTMLLALPLSLVAGLMVGLLAPAVAASAAQVAQAVGIGSDAAVPADSVGPATNDAASTLAADDSAHPGHGSSGRRDREPRATVADTASNDDLGLGDSPAAGPAGTVARADTANRDGSGAAGNRAARQFDPADPALGYRYPTVTGQTVDPPTRVVAKISQSLPLPASSGSGRRIVYSASGQHLWIVDGSGTVVRDYPVTGRADRPGPGRYSVYSKSQESYNPIAKVSFTHMVRFAYGVTGASIGFHSIPKWQNGAPLQTPESLGLALGRGGCIRQTMANAAFLYDWVRLGDRVTVVA